MKHYSPEFIKEIRRPHLEEGRSISSISAEYKVSKSTISKWVKEFREECLYQHGGVPGYRTVHYYIKQLGICIKNHSS